MKHFERTQLGAVDAFPQLPAQIRVGSQTFFLVRDDAGFRLLSTVCPHAGGAVYDEGSRFECPLHGWRFDRMTGRCLNAPSRHLDAVPVTIVNGMLVAELPREPLVRVRQGGRNAKAGLTVQLHAHACLEISYDGFTLLTDPWLDGPAFLGAWAHYPPPHVITTDLRPNAILITHEHSDHFHEPTLRHFDRRTPVIVPDFPNQRLQRRLHLLGFVDVRVARFGEPTELHDGWWTTAFEPLSFWNDAFVLIEVDGFRIFNINDAGVNARIAPLVAPVDVIAVQSSGGASGYPWTWAHLTDEQKAEIATRACAGKLRLTREAAVLYDAKDVIPFASYFTPWHETHLAYAAMMKRNTVRDIQNAVADLGVGVIDVLPGDTWDVGTGAVRRASGDRDRLFEPAVLSAYRRTAVSAATFAAYHPSVESLSTAELTAYLKRLNDVPEIALCEDLTVSIVAQSATSGVTPLRLSFAIHSGHLTILPTPPEVPNLTMTIPRAVLTAVVREDLSWDEAFIGYWCRFERHPNVYHAGFWRLLQAPYLRRPPDTRPAPAGGLERRSTIAEILEIHGAEADRILRRHGLYCSGCHHSTAESLEMAARQHGIDSGQLDVLIRQLNRTFGAPVEHTD